MGETWRREEGIKLQTGGHREQGKTVQKGAEEQDRSRPSRAANRHRAKGNETLLMGERAPVWVAGIPYQREGQPQRSGRGDRAADKERPPVF